MKNKWGLGIVMVAALLLCCMMLPKSSHAGDKTTLYILAGAGLKDSLNALKEAYAKKNPGVEIRYNYASAGVLQKQIEEGVPGDVFIVPGKKQMDALQKEGLIRSDTRVNLLGNEIVLVVAKEKKGVIKSFNDLADKAHSISIGFPESVPAGKYARETLRNLGLWNHLEKRIIFAKDVRTVLAYVDSGNVDAGLVYRSDTVVMRSGTIVAAAPKDSHSPINFIMAMLQSSKYQNEAGKFMEFLKTPEASAIFLKNQFIPLFGKHMTANQ